MQIKLHFQKKYCHYTKPFSSFYDNSILLNKNMKIKKTYRKIIINLVANGCKLTKILEILQKSYNLMDISLNVN